MKVFSVMGILFLYSIQFSFAQDKTVKQEKLSCFELQSSELISEPGEVLSSPGYQSNVYWFPVKIPSTVLTGLVANGVYPDPYQGMNNMLIPDASDRFNKMYHLEKYSHLPNSSNPWKKPYWYRTSFQVPSKDQGKHFQLIFKGINYRAAVWLNGKQIADSAQMAGMFAEYSFDVSKMINAGEKNALAVKIYPLDDPGFPAQEQLKAMGDFFLNGGPTGDIGKNVTMLCSVGWDWMPPVRDRNIGIWQPVYLRTTGKVTITRPHIITELPDLPDTSVANLSLSLSLSNYEKSVSNGRLKISINPENFVGQPINFTKEISIPGGAKKTVELNPSNTGELAIKQPRLWWPNGYGKSNLYRLQLKYEINGEVSDDTTLFFGIRTISTEAVDVPGKFVRRYFFVNGKKVHLVGGAWVPDMMLNRDSARYDAELRLCRNGNVNLVRIWGGGITPPDIFFDLADRYGLMVWSDFWITGDTNGEFKGSPDWPLESNVFVKNMTSTIYRIRNHASLLLWTGGNEGHARKELYDAMRDSVIALDGTRPFIPCSSGKAKLPEGWKGSWPDNKASGVYSGGPYTWQNLKQYYHLANDAKDWVFKDETGIPSQPPYSILPKIIPNLVWDKTLPFPLNNSWGYHDAATGNGRYDLYYNTMVRQYGKPASMKEFSDKMQLMNATGYQGIFEAAGHKLNDNGGIMLWKLNAALPSVIWQVYDWYLTPNAGYYFMQKACEPLHVQLNPLTNKVTVVNRTYNSYRHLILEADIFGINSESLLHQTDNISIAPVSVKESVSLSGVLNESKEVCFVVLRLKNTEGKVASENIYWLSGNDDYTAMNKMDKARVTTTIQKALESTTDKTWTLQFSNKSRKLAFFIHPMVTGNGEEILPSFWSSNYFSLAPGDSITVTVSVPAGQIKNKELKLLVDGWNCAEQVISLDQGKDREN